MAYSNNYRCYLVWCYEKYAAKPVRKSPRFCRREQLPQTATFSILPSP